VSVRYPRYVGRADSQLDRFPKVKKNYKNSRRFKSPLKVLENSWKYYPYSPGLTKAFLGKLDASQRICEKALRSVW